MSTLPPAIKVRSALVIVETETGETFQMALTPSDHQPVEVTIQTEYDWSMGEWSARHTVTIVAGNYYGQFRTPTHTATQTEPTAVES